MDERTPLANRRSRTRATNPGVIAWLVVFLAFQPGLALAAPQGEQVVQGDVSFDRSTPDLTLIHASDRSIIEYGGFDIGGAETVRFVQPGEDARVLNRVLSADPTRIDGTLLANGRVYLVNPSGVIFGEGARVDVAQLFAIAGQLSNFDFQRGLDRFQGLGGVVENFGHLSADSVNLVGRYVANHGTIEAERGLIALVAGEDVLLGHHGGRVFVHLPGGSGGDAEAGVRNTGTLAAGAVVMSAGDFYALAVRQEGRVEASRVLVEGGAGGTVWVSGEIDANASASDADGIGGDVAILGERVALTGARIDASGDAGGGDIRIGGGWQGSGETASHALVSADSVLLADALREGDGGTIVVWADETTRFRGSASARGGALAGDGGQIETSGRQFLDTAGARIDAGATNGRAGQWLLDPTDVFIARVAAQNIDFFDDGGRFFFFDEVPPRASVIDIASIEDALKIGTNVTVSSFSSANAAGDIVLVDDLLANPGQRAELALRAAGGITLLGSILHEGGAPLDVILDASGATRRGGVAGVRFGVEFDPALLWTASDFPDIELPPLPSGPSFGEVQTGGGDLAVTSAVPQGAVLLGRTTTGGGAVSIVAYDDIVLQADVSTSGGAFDASTVGRFELGATLATGGGDADIWGGDGVFFHLDPDQSDIAGLLDAGLGSVALHGAFDPRLAAVVASLPDFAQPAAGAAVGVSGGPGSLAPVRLPLVAPGASPQLLAGSFSSEGSSFSGHVQAGSIALDHSDELDVRATADSFFATGQSVIANLDLTISGEVELDYAAGTQIASLALAGAGPEASVAIRGGGVEILASSDGAPTVLLDDRSLLLENRAFGAGLLLGSGAIGGVGDVVLESPVPGGPSLLGVQLSPDAIALESGSVEIRESGGLGSWFRVDGCASCVGPQEEPGPAENLRVGNIDTTSGLSIGPDAVSVARGDIHLTPSGIEGDRVTSIESLGLATDEGHVEVDVAADLLLSDDAIGSAARPVDSARVRSRGGSILQRDPHDGIAEVNVRGALSIDAAADVVLEVGASDAMASLSVSRASRSELREASATRFGAVAFDQGVGAEVDFAGNGDTVKWSGGELLSLTQQNDGRISTKDRSVSVIYPVDVEIESGQVVVEGGSFELAVDDGAVRASENDSQPEIRASDGVSISAVRIGESDNFLGIEVDDASTLELKGTSFVEILGALAGDLDFDFEVDENDVFELRQGSDTLRFDNGVLSADLVANGLDFKLRNGTLRVDGIEGQTRAVRVEALGGALDVSAKGVRTQGGNIELLASQGMTISGAIESNGGQITLGSRANDILVQLDADVRSAGGDLTLLSPARMSAAGGTVLDAGGGRLETSDLDQVGGTGAPLTLRGDTIVFNSTIQAVGDIVIETGNRDPDVATIVKQSGDLELISTLGSVRMSANDKVQVRGGAGGPGDFRVQAAQQARIGAVAAEGSIDISAGEVVLLGAQDPTIGAFTVNAGPNAGAVVSYVANAIRLNATGGPISTPEATPPSFATPTGAAGITAPALNLGGFTVLSDAASNVSPGPGVLGSFVVSADDVSAALTNRLGSVLSEEAATQRQNIDVAAARPLWADEVIAFLECAPLDGEVPGGCELDPEDETQLADQRFESEAALAALRIYRDLVAEAETMREAFGVAMAALRSAEESGTVSGEQFRRYLERSESHAAALGYLERLRTLFAEVGQLGITDDQMGDARWLLLESIAPQGIDAETLDEAVGGDESARLFRLASVR